MFFEGDESGGWMVVFNGDAVDFVSVEAQDVDAGVWVAFVGGE